MDAKKKPPGGGLVGDDWRGRFRTGRAQGSVAEKDVNSARAYGCKRSA